MSEATAPDDDRRRMTGEQFISWIVPRLAGDDGDKETAMVMILAHMQDRYVKGIEDARYVVQNIADLRPRSAEARVLADGLKELERRAKERPVTAL